MSTTENVTLNVRNQPANGQGWQNTTASNGQQYSYKYQGGHDNTGGMKTKVGDGPATLNLNLSTDNRYELASANPVTFRDDTNAQLTWTGTNSSSGKITDVNTMVETAEYVVLVCDTQNGNVTIPCDPMIGNDPRGPKIMHT